MANLERKQIRKLEAVTLSKTVIQVLAYQLQKKPGFVGEWETIRIQGEK